MEQPFIETDDTDKLDRSQTSPKIEQPQESNTNNNSDNNSSDAPIRNETDQVQEMGDKHCSVSSSRTPTTPTPVLYHHRRKRSRVSPLNRLSHLGSDEQSSYPSRMLTSTTDEHHHRLDPIKDSSHEPSPDESTETETALLNLPPLDSEFRDLLDKYVRSESVVRSLELAGFSSPYVLIRLDELQLQKLEQFVGHACSAMKSVHLREQFTGPIFSRNPTQFKLPSGAVCGILLAAGELRRKYRRTQLISGSIPDSDHNLVDDYFDRDLVETSCQTDITFPPLCPNGTLLNNTSCLNDHHQTNHASSIVDVDLSPPPANSGILFPTDTATSRTGRTGHTISAPNQTTGSPNQTLKLENNVPTTSAGTAAIVAAALQAAAAAATVPNLDSTLFASHSVEASTTGLDAAAASFATGLNSAFPSTFPNDLCMGLHNSLSASTVNVRGNSNTVNSLAMSTSCAGGGVNTNSGLASQSNFVMATNANGGFDEELVDLERLKQHSSASAIRLASRQFINAYLMRGRDFDLEMELSITPEGCKRVTGIFYCHLCREKRERTSAVRFSIARNRYPVLSNVLSHLKTHFHYRGSMVSAPHHNNSHHQHQILHQTKTNSNLNDSFVGTGATTHSPNSFPNPTNCSAGYRTELSLDPCNNSLGQFASHHIKPESMTYAYQVDNGSTDDSNHGHGTGVYDNLGGSPTRSINSPIDKCSPQTGTGHNLRLDSSGPSLSDNVKNNSCNSLTS